MNNIFFFIYSLKLSLDAFMLFSVMYLNFIQIRIQDYFLDRCVNTDGLQVCTNILY